jgi:hypothetical protein
VATHSFFLDSSDITAIIHLHHTNLNTIIHTAVQQAARRLLLRSPVIGHFTSIRQHLQHRHHDPPLPKPQRSISFDRRV